MEMFGPFDGFGELSDALRQQQADKAARQKELVEQVETNGERLKEWLKDNVPVEQVAAITLGVAVETMMQDWINTGVPQNVYYSTMRDMCIKAFGLQFDYNLAQRLKKS